MTDEKRGRTLASLSAVLCDKHGLHLLAA